MIYSDNESNTGSYQPRDAVVTKPITKTEITFHHKQVLISGGYNFVIFELPENYGGHSWTNQAYVMGDGHVHKGAVKLVHKVSTGLVGLVIIFMGLPRLKLLAE